MQGEPCDLRSQAFAPRTASNVNCRNLNAFPLGLASDDYVLYLRTWETALKTISWEVVMKVQDTTFSKEQLVDCAQYSADAAEACRLALNKIRALELKIARLGKGRKGSGQPSG